MKMVCPAYRRFLQTLFTIGINGTHAAQDTGGLSHSISHLVKFSMRHHLPGKSSPTEHICLSETLHTATTGRHGSTAPLFDSSRLEVRAKESFTAELTRSHFVLVFPAFSTKCGVVWLKLIQSTTSRNSPGFPSAASFSGPLLMPHIEHP